MNLFRLVVAAFLLTFLSSGFSSAQDNSMQYYQAANTLYSQQNYDQAIQYYQAALQQNPQMWQADQGLGNCYYAKGDKATALADYQKSLAINPNNPPLSQFVQTLQPQPNPSLPPSSGGPTASSASPAPSSSAPIGGINRNLPRQGKIVFEIEDSDWIGSWDDINNIYGETTTSSSTPIGVKLGLGAAYVISPNFQLGVKLQYMKKTEEAVEIDDLETITWDEAAAGGALEAEGVFPMSDGINFIGSLEGGFYTLVGSTVTDSYTNESVNLTGSGPGGMLSAGVEFLMDSRKTWSLDLGLDYQFISFSPITITDTATGQTATLPNANGTNASLDFSGVGLFVAARFY